MQIGELKALVTKAQTELSKGRGVGDTTALLSVCVAHTGYVQTQTHAHKQAISVLM